MTNDPMTDFDETCSVCGFKSYGVSSRECLKCGGLNLPHVEAQIRKMVDRFLTWPLPDSVCADPCASMPGHPHRSGTNLLTAPEARQMLEYVLSSAPHAEQPEGMVMVREAALRELIGDKWPSLTHAELDDHEGDWRERAEECVNRIRVMLATDQGDSHD